MGYTELSNRDHKMARYPSPADVNWSIGIQEAPKYINEVTHGVVLNLVLLAIGIIIGTSYWFGKRDLPGAIAVGAFVTWIFALLGWLGDYIGGFNFVFVTAVMIGSAVYVIVTTSSNA